MHNLQPGDLCWNSTSKAYICLVLESQNGYKGMKVLLLSTKWLNPYSLAWVGKIDYLTNAVPLETIER